LLQGAFHPMDGSPATLAPLDRPEGLTLDANGHLLIAEAGGNAIRLADVGANAWRRGASLLQSGMAYDTTLQQRFRR